MLVDGYFGCITGMVMVMVIGVFISTGEGLVMMMMAVDMDYVVMMWSYGGDGDYGGNRVLVFIGFGDGDMVRGGVDCGVGRLLGGGLALVGNNNLGLIFGVVMLLSLLGLVISSL